VEAAGDLVALAAELAAGVQLRQDDRQCRQSLLGDHVHRNARAGVSDGDRVVRVNRHLDEIVASCQSLVDGVVDDFVDEVMKAPRTRRPDVHPGSQTDGLEALQNGDVFRGVRCFSH
jgi:hypothetical protein